MIHLQLKNDPIKRVPNEAKVTHEDPLFVWFTEEQTYEEQLVKSIESTYVWLKLALFGVVTVITCFYLGKFLLTL